MVRPDRTANRQIIKEERMGRENRTNRKWEKGFTLIELLIVLVILGLLAGLVAPKMFGKVDKARQKTTKTQIELLATACDGPVLHSCGNMSFTRC